MPSRATRAPAPEIELKLAVTGGKVSAARRALPRGQARAAVVDTLYFDTPAGLLRQHGLALRMRRDGGKWFQTLKAADPGGQLVAARGEWETALGAGRRRPALDLAALVNTPLRKLVDGGLLRPDELVPAFRSRFVRRRLTVDHRGSSIEVALDEGELVATTDGRTRREALAEVELELKAGTPLDVLDYARRLMRKGRPTLVPAVRSKAERGYALASGGDLPVARATASGFARLMSADIGAGDALRSVVRHALAVLVANADAMRGASEPEHLHQARVALRRLRSAIRLLDPAGADLPARLASRLRWLARALGEARDCDVLVDTTVPALLAAEGGTAKHGGDLLDCARHLRAQAMKEAVGAVSSRRYATLVLDLAQWSATSGPPAVRLASTAPVLLEPLAEALERGGRAFGHLSRRERHRVRIHAKRLRYALDLLAFALPGPGTSDFVDALADLQDTLGELNDAAVAWERLHRAAPGRRRSRRLVKQWHDEVEPALVRKAARELKALARRARPWTSPAALHAPEGIAARVPR